MCIFVNGFNLIFIVIKILSFKNVIEYLRIEFNIFDFKILEKCIYLWILEFILIKVFIGIVYMNVFMFIYFLLSIYVIIIIE